MTESYIIANRIRTPDGTILESTHRHDYVSYKDENGSVYAVDGGKDYLRRSFSPGAPPYTDLSVYSTDPHEVVREALKWGTHGKNGDEPLRRVALCDMTDDHIQACLDTQDRMLPAYRQAMERELEYRKTL